MVSQPGQRNAGDGTRFRDGFAAVCGSRNTGVAPQLRHLSLVSAAVGHAIDHSAVRGGAAPHRSGAPETGAAFI